jgi:hypothetical protein
MGRGMAKIENPARSRVFAAQALALVSGDDRGFKATMRGNCETDFGL